MFYGQKKVKDVVPDGFAEETVWVLDGEEVREGTEDAEELGIHWR